MRRRTKGGAILEAAIILTGLALLFQACSNAASTYRFINAAEQEDGQITGIADKGFTLYIQFGTGAGSGIVFSQSGLVYGRQVGEHVPVLYDADNPSHAMMNRPGALWWKPVALLLPGILLGWFGFRLRNSRNL